MTFFKYNVRYYKSHSALQNYEIRKATAFLNEFIAYNISSLSCVPLFIQNYFSWNMKTWKYKTMPEITHFCERHNATALKTDHLTSHFNKLYHVFMWIIMNKK